MGCTAICGGVSVVFGIVWLMAETVGESWCCCCVCWDVAVLLAAIDVVVERVDVVFVPNTDVEVSIVLFSLVLADISFVCNSLLEM